jgi:hypothetical protein
MKWLLAQRMTLWSGAVAVAFWPAILAAAYTPRWAMVGVGAPLMPRFDPRAVSKPILWMLLWSLAAAALSLRMSPDVQGGALELFLMALLCGVFVIGAGLDSLDQVMMGAAIGIGVSSIFCMLQVANLVDMHQMTGAAWRYPGLFLNSELLGEFAAPVLAWAIVQKRWWLVAVILPAAVLSNSRVGALALLAALAWTWRPRSIAGTAFLVACLIGIGILTTLYFDLIMDTGIGRLQSAGTRVVVWGATIMAFTWIGNGLGWFQVAHPPEEFAHSDVLQSIAEVGPAALVFLAVPVLIFMRQRGTHAERAAFIVVCIEALVSFPLHMPASGFLAAIIAGYLAGNGSGIRVPEPVRRVADGSSVQWTDASYEGHPYRREQCSASFPL